MIFRLQRYKIFHNMQKIRPCGMRSISRLIFAYYENYIASSTSSWAVKILKNIVNGYTVA